MRESHILDLVISSDINMVTDVEVLDHLGNSVHNIIVQNLVCNVSVGKSKMQYRQYHKAYYATMRERLSNIDWDIEFNDLDVDELWSKFCYFIEKAFDQFVPLRYSKSKKTPKWMNRNAQSKNCNIIIH